MRSFSFHFPLFQPGDVFLEYLGLVLDTVLGKELACSRECRVVMNVRVVPQSGLSFLLLFRGSDHRGTIENRADVSKHGTGKARDSG